MGAGGCQGPGWRPAKRRAPSWPHPHCRQREQKNSLKRDVPSLPGKGGEVTEAPLPGPGRPGSRPPTTHTGPPAAPAPAAAQPLPAAPAPRLTQSVRSGETAAGAWERAAPAGVGLRRRSPPGRTGPGSRERGRGGRRKWGRGGGHTLSPPARRSRGAPPGAKARTSRSGEKFPNRILPPRAQSASSALRLPPPARWAPHAPLH